MILDVLRTKWVLPARSVLSYQATVSDAWRKHDVAISGLVINKAKASVKGRRLSEIPPKSERREVRIHHVLAYGRLDNASVDSYPRDIIHNTSIFIDF